MTEERSSLSFYHQQYYEDSLAMGSTMNMSEDLNFTLAMVFYYEHVQRPNRPSLLPVSQER